MCPTPVVEKEISQPLPGDLRKFQRTLLWKTGVYASRMITVNEKGVSRWVIHPIYSFLTLTIYLLASIAVEVVCPLDIPTGRDVRACITPWLLSFFIFSSDTCLYQFSPTNKILCLNSWQTKLPSSGDDTLLSYSFILPWSSHLRSRFIRVLAIVFNNTESHNS